MCPTALVRGGARRRALYWLPNGLRRGAGLSAARLLLELRLEVRELEDPSPTCSPKHSQRSFTFNIEGHSARLKKYC